MFTFHRTYFLLTILLFCIEIFIALYVRDQFFRPYVGDILVVMLIYCFLKSFLKLPTILVALAVLVFACNVEFLQYLNIAEILGFERSSLAGTIIGATFSWMDILSYIVGIAIVIAVEKFIKTRV